MKPTIMAELGQASKGQRAAVCPQDMPEKQRQMCSVALKCSADWGIVSVFLPPVPAQWFQLASEQTLEMCFNTGPRRSVRVS